MNVCTSQFSLISNYLISGKRVVDAFSGMAGLGGMGVGILAWCHQQLRYKKANLSKLLLGTLKFCN